MVALRDVGERWTLSSLLQRFVDTPGLTSRATRDRQAVAAAAIRTDALGVVTAGRLNPAVLSDAVARWRRAGASEDAVRRRAAVVRSAIAWAVWEGYLIRDVLVGFRGVPASRPRTHAPVNVVQEAIAAVRHDLAVARAAWVARLGSRSATVALFRAYQRLLAMCLVAETGLRRGELAGLRTDDLLDRELWVERASKRVGGEFVIGSTKTYQSRRVTISRTTASLWREYLTRWWGPAAVSGVESGWLFPASPGSSRQLSPTTVAGWFVTVTGTLSDTGESVSLHRVRHTVATVLVGQGQLTAAQRRLGHRKLDSTLRHCVDTTGVEDDAAVADELAAFYAGGDDHPLQY